MYGPKYRTQSPLVFGALIYNPVWKIVQAFTHLINYSSTNHIYIPYHYVINYSSRYHIYIPYHYIIKHFWNLAAEINKHKTLIKNKQDSKQFVVLDFHLYYSSLKNLWMQFATILEWKIGLHERTLTHVRQSHLCRKQHESSNRASVSELHASACEGSHWLHYTNMTSGTAHLALHLISTLLFECCTEKQLSVVNNWSGARFVKGHIAPR